MNKNAPSFAAAFAKREGATVDKATGKPVTHLAAVALAQRWNVSVGTLSNWRCQGVGPKWRRLAGSNPRAAVVYSIAEVERYEKKHGKPAGRKRRRA